MELLKVCIRLYNISYAEEHFGGCISLELDYFYFKKDVDLGCIYENQLEDQSKGTPRDIFTPRDILLWIFGEDKLKTVRSFFGELREDVQDGLDRSQIKKNSMNVWNPN